MRRPNVNWILNILLGLCYVLFYGCLIGTVLYCYSLP